MYEYTLLRSKRKTISLTVASNGEIIVKAPLKMPNQAIADFVAKHSSWLESRKQTINQLNETNGILSSEQILALRQKAQEIIPPKVAYWGNTMKVKPNQIKITSATHRWGSCNTKHNICFSYRIMLLPDELIDLIIVHELAHTKILNHSKDFYHLLEQYIPDYKSRGNALKKLSQSLPLSLK